MALNTALSGLQAASTELSVIGNNVANVSTTGFKKSRVEFADVYATSNLGVSANAVGTGVNVADVSQVFSQGQIAYTDSNLDMAISGLGFFMTNDSAGTTYTRSGAFRLDKEGFITNSKGANLQGYLPKDGLIGEEIGDLQINTSSLNPAETTEIDLQVNLNSQDTAPAVPFPKGFSRVNPPPANSFNSSTSTTVYDAQGEPHTLTFYFVKMHAQNSWHAYVGVDGQDVTPDDLPQSSYPDLNSGGGSTFGTGMVPKPFTLVFDDQGLMIPNKNTNDTLYYGRSMFTTNFGESDLYDAGQLPMFESSDFTINGTAIDPVLDDDDVFSTTDAKASAKGISEAINKYTSLHGATAIPDHAVLSMGSITTSQNKGAVSNFGQIAVNPALNLANNDFVITVTEGNDTYDFQVTGAITDTTSLVTAISNATVAGGGTALSSFLNAEVINDELNLETLKSGLNISLHSDSGGNTLSFPKILDNNGNSVSLDDLTAVGDSVGAIKLFDSINLNANTQNLVINGVPVEGEIRKETATDDLILAINKVASQTRVEAYKDIDSNGVENIALRTTIETEKGRNIQITSNPLSATNGFSLGFSNLLGDGQLGANLFEINNTNSFNKVIRANYTLSMEHTAAEIVASPAIVDMGPIENAGATTAANEPLFRYTDLSTLDSDGTSVSITISADATPPSPVTVEYLASRINEALYENWADHIDTAGNGEPFFDGPIAKAIIKRVDGENRLIIEAQDKGRDFRLDSAANAVTNIEFENNFVISNSADTLLVEADDIPSVETGYENEPLILGGRNNGANLDLLGFAAGNLQAGVIHTSSDNITLDQWLNDSSSISINVNSSTQFGTDFSVGEMSQDGYAAGLLSNIDVDDVGIIYARYNNGESSMLGQVALAYFSNPQGLKPVGDSSWTNSFASGSPLEGKASTGRFGLIQAGSLESSNVDLTEELVTLIVAQRNFQANAQTIRTFDQVTQTITNIR